MAALKIHDIDTLETLSDEVMGLIVGGNAPDDFYQTNTQEVGVDSADLSDGFMFDNDGNLIDINS